MSEPIPPSSTRRSADEISRWLVRWVAAELGSDPSSVDVGAPFVNLGLSSRQAVVLSGELEEYLGRELEPSITWDHPTIERLAAHLGADGGG